MIFVVETVVAFAPSKATSNPPFVIPPVNVRPPAPDNVIVLALPSVTIPDKLAAEALLFSKAPPLLTPVPLIVTASPTTVCPFRSNAPPLATVVPASVVPSPRAFPSFTVPTLIAVAPE